LTNRRSRDIYESRSTYENKGYLEKLGKIRGNRYLGIITVSFIIALIMSMTLFGIYGIIMSKELPVPHYSILLLAFAVFFILIFEFFDSKVNVTRLVAGVLGFICAFCITVIIAALIQSIKMTIYQMFGSFGIGWEMIVTSISVCMIISVIGIKMLLSVIEKD